MSLLQEKGRSTVTTDTVAATVTVEQRRPPILIEVCVDSVESALAAVRGGANRLEICGNLGLGGGTTPSTGLVRLIKKNCPGHISLMAMVRPRTGDFVYSENELSVMLEDIANFAELGVDGVVFGALLPDGSVDLSSTRLFVNTAREAGLEVCFHRAFDMVENQEDVLQTLLNINGITRILTSGGGPSAPSSLPSLLTLATLLQSTPEPSLSLMPGSGINAQTVQPLFGALLPLGVREVHLSGGGWVDGVMRYRPENMGMGVGGKGEWGVWRTSEEVVRDVRRLVDEEWARSGLDG